MEALLLLLFLTFEGLHDNIKFVIIGYTQWIKPCSKSVKNYTLGSALETCRFLSKHFRNLLHVS